MIRSLGRRYRGDLWSPACPRIHQPVGRDDLGAPSACRDASGARRFFEGGFAGFLSEAPPAPPTRRAPHFFPKKWGKEGAGGGFRFHGLRWLRLDFFWAKTCHRHVSLHPNRPAPTP